MIAVSDDTCPHCVKYKPTWNTLAKTEGRNVPMISMPSSVYNQTHLAKQKEVKGVPTVLYVSPNGTVNEVEDIRDETKMTSLLRSNSNSKTESATNIEDVIPTNIPIIKPTNMPANVPKALQIPGLTEAADFPTIPVSRVNAAVNSSSPSLNSPSLNSPSPSPNSPSPSLNSSSPNIVPNKPTNTLEPVLPGVTTQTNPLTPLPGKPVPSEVQNGGAYGRQTGGDPWSAFMMAAKQAAPAAGLLGAYSMMRSSGLGRPRSRSRRHRR